MAETIVALVPIEERQVDFYGDDITAALVEIDDQEQIYVPVRPICEYLGLDWSAQLKRIKRDEELAGSTTSVAMMASLLGRSYNAICLPLELLPGWLFGIDANRVKPELKEKIRRYRRECYKVLWKAFQDDALVAAARSRRVWARVTLRSISICWVAISAIARPISRI